MNQDFLPIGCRVENIHRGKGSKSDTVYAKLRGPDGNLIISADIDYISKRLAIATFIPNEEYLKKFI